MFLQFSEEARQQAEREEAERKEREAQESAERKRLEDEVKYLYYTRI